MRLLTAGVVYLLGIAGCVVGEQAPWQPESDAAVGVADADLGSPDAAVQPACEPAATVIPDGHHNEGQACLTCHAAGNGNGAPVFSMGGTLYTSAAGIAPLSNATIVVTDAAGLTLELATATNGNFYSSATLTLPLTVKASKCPDERAMGNQPDTGDCNGCHTANAGQGRIHLP